MYISAVYNKRTDHVDVWERNSNNIRVKCSHPARYYMYQHDPDGEFISITNVKCKKVVVSSQADLDHLAIAIPYAKRFETDFTQIDRILMDVYSIQSAPVLNIGFFDIEVDYSPERGFSSISNPYAPINAVTVYSTYESKFVTIAVPPKSWVKTALPDSLSNVILCKNERELLTKFLDVIHPIDVLSGWNSEFFDIPYIAKRLEIVLGDSSIQRLGFENSPTPRWSEKERFKNAAKKEPVLIMQSRIHLDYMQLFKKFNLVSRQSYSLNAIGLDELNVPKISYPGTLAELYNNDFELFLEYNIHDVKLVRDIDAKLKYINLANQMIHMASVNFDAIFGSVHLIDSAIITYAHNVLKKVVFDRVSRSENEKVEGALVVTPTPGKYRYIGSVDLNSLYPNTIRSTGLSPEKIVGQFIDTEMAWNYISKGLKGNFEENVKLQFIFDSDSSTIHELNVREIVDMLIEQKWSITAYGTIIDQGNGIGILPSVLGYWFKGRKELQAEKKKYSKLADQAIKEGDVAKFEEYHKLAEYYDMLQGVRKVLLNSTYGALLNAYMRFGDPRLGASTTYTGRQITSHMINTISSILNPNDNVLPNVVKKKIIETRKTKRTGEIEITHENDYTIELNETAGVVYGDTDSSYFTMEGLVNNIEESIELADGIAEYVNSTFDDFMRLSFNCQPDYLGLIRAAREIVAYSGIFQAKKKYMLALADKEGKRVNRGDEDELKTMGSDIKLSSTPDVIKGFLKNIVMSILYDSPKDEINQAVIDFRNSLHSGDTINPLDIATIMNVKELDDYQARWEMIEHAGKGKVTIPAHVRAAINFNHFIKVNQFNFEHELISGNKVKVVWLKPNKYNFNAIALSSDEERFPDWFNDHFEPDLDLLEQKLVDQKLDNIFVALNWMVPTKQSMLTSNLLDIEETRKEKKTKRKPKQESSGFGLEF